MLVQLIRAANDSGHAAARMGQGPERIVVAGAVDRLRSSGHQVETIRVESRNPFPTEIATAFETAGQLARQVRMATAQRRFPVVLAGNCMASIGVLGAFPRGHTGLVWLDAHGDFNTPDSSRSGFLDGMALATAVGHCWAALTAQLPRFRPVPVADVLLLGARDVDELELARIAEHRLTWMDVDGVRADPGGVAAAMGELGQRTDRVHLHIDLDVLDPDLVAPANRFAATGGLSLPELLELIGVLRSHARIGSVTLSAYDPSYDRNDRMLEAALSLLDALVSP